MVRKQAELTVQNKSVSNTAPPWFCFSSYFPVPALLEFLSRRSSMIDCYLNVYINKPFPFQVAFDHSVFYHSNRNPAKTPVFDNVFNGENLIISIKSRAKI